MKTKRLTKIVPLMFGILIASVGQSFAQGTLLKAKIKKVEVPTVIIDEVLDNFEGYELDEIYAIPVNIIEDDIIIEDENQYPGEYDTYEIQMKKGNDELTAYYNRNGKLIYEVEKANNVTPPATIRNMIAKEYPGWTITKDMYLMKHHSGDKVKNRYKIYLKKGRNKIRIYTDENGKVI